MKKTEMKKVRELLDLHILQGISSRGCAKITGLSKTTASEYLSGFKASGLSLIDAKLLSDSDLLSALTGPNKLKENTRYSELLGKFAYIEKELCRAGVTLHLLWEELYGATGQGYSYAQFCHHYKQWSKKQKVSMHMEHKAGDKMFVDYTGVRQSICDPNTGEITELEVFVAVLGGSQKSYLEAVPSQKKHDWIRANENALRYFGGSPSCIVPDCLKSAVTKAYKWEPQVNESYKDFAAYYGTVILPARALHPQDKSLAENFVKTAYTRIFAPLRNTPYFSIEELNQALWEQLEKHNNTPFQGKDFSREELFQSIESTALKPLPTEQYDLRNFAVSTVQYNHHVFLKEDKHYYSVPYRLTGAKVQISYNSSLVEISHNNLRVATHPRNYHPYQYSTQEAHRPENHQFVAGWDAQRFLDWAAKISPPTHEFIQELIQRREHPEQAFNSCMGILSLSRKYPKEDFIKACTMALKLKVYNYRFFNNILINKTFNIHQQEEKQTVITHDQNRSLSILN
jgi:transposase